MTFLSDRLLAHLQQAAATDPIGHPRYAVLERVGAGGMGDVYRARDRELDREVALKVMHAHLLDADVIRRVEQEARIIARLEHPGIVPVHDVGRLPDGRVYYVMKLVRGRRLDQHITPQARLADRLRIFERICEAVAFAHARGVIHRDLKPQNVMIGEFGEVLVLDWGIARLLDAAPAAAAPHAAPADPPPPRTDAFDEWATRTHATTPGAVLGTPAFMPPEQARGEHERVGQRSDVFALGALLYFLLTGEAPVTHTLFAAQRQGLSGRDDPDAAGDAAPRGAADGAIRSPRQRDRSIPRPLAAICMRALALDPLARYDSAAGLAADVARFRDGAPVSAYRENPLERLVRFGVKYRTALLLVAAYLAMRAALTFLT